MKVAVLYGGTSEEREVSLNSGQAIVNACNQLGYEVTALDLNHNMMSLIPELAQADVVFNGLHGGEGENGVIPGFLQSLGLTYTGSGNEASAVCMDKRLSKALVHRKSILTPEWISISKEDSVFEDHGLDYPVVIKPNGQGSTIGLTIVHEESHLKKAIELAFQFDQIALIESYIEGREITVTIIGNRAYPIVEIVPNHDLYDYECKYTKGMTQYSCPADLSDALTQQIQTTALYIHKLLGCRHYSRVDFRLDNNNKAWFLEVNTLPGMTETSLVPKAAKAMGMEFPELIKTILNEALNT